MKGALLALARGHDAPGVRLNVVREWLQAAMLKSLERHGAMASLAFHGGTALRFVYGIGRYSEDLDFAWHGSHAKGQPAAWLGHVKADLWNLGLASRVGVAERERMVEARFDFRALAQELALPNLGVKVEVALRAPSTARVEHSTVTRVETLSVTHHDRATLFAGKLHAILYRHYCKGRDYYDLLWYLGHPSWPAPNLPFLNDALRQVAWKGGALTEESWRGAVLARLQRVDWAAARRDVEPYLENPEDARLLTRETLERALAAPQRAFTMRDLALPPGRGPRRRG